MANLIRSAKPSKDWTSADLQAYNIRISTVDTEEFFDVPHLPPPTVDPIVLNNIEAPVDPNLSPGVRDFFRLLRDVITPPMLFEDDGPALPAAHEESHYVVEFSFHVLRNLLQISLPGRQMIPGGYPLRFIVSGKLVRAKLDMVMVDSENHILLILEDNGPFPQDQAESRLVAKALAAFQSDDYGRTAVGLPPMLSNTYIGIVMIGAEPHFYKISIARALVYAVRHGLFPAEETIVQRFIPLVPNMYEGMLSLENRRVYFQCFEALKALL